jgi:hypothetical protein
MWCDFMWAKRYLAKNINKGILPVKAKNILSCKSGSNRPEKFVPLQPKLEDSDGKLEITTDAVMSQMDALIRSDIRVRTGNEAEAMGSSHVSACSLMSDLFFFFYFLLTVRPDTIV